MKATNGKWWKAAAALALWGLCGEAYAQTPYNLAIESSKLCVDVQWGSTAAGAPIIQWDCHDGDNQIFIFKDTGSGRFQIQAKHSGRCLQAYSNNSVLQQNCSASADQRFQLVSRANGAKAIRSVKTGRCFAVSGNSLSIGAIVNQKTCGDVASQRFKMKNLAPAPETQPYAGTPAALPGKVEAENYDLGGAGKAYSDLTAGNAYNLYRNDDVDISAGGSGYRIGYTEPGEYLKYTVKVTAAGSYQFVARASTTESGKSLHFEVDNVNVTGAVAVPSTGGWDTFKDVASKAVSLSSGSHVVKVVFDTAFTDLDYFQVVSASAPQPAPTPTPTPTPTPSPTPTPTPSGFTLGQRPFAATSSWNKAVPSTASYTRLNWPKSTGYNYGVAWDSYSPAVYIAKSTDPVVDVSMSAGWGYPGGIVKVRIPAGVSGASGTDGELLVIDGTTVHNFWQFKRNGTNSASVSAYGRTDILTGSGWGTRSPFLGAGIVATGSSQMAGLLVQAESDAGEIAHALQITLDFPLQRPGFTGEAISGDGSSSTGISQEGERLAIPKSVAMPAGLSPLGQKVFRALQNYGAFNIDVSGGTSNLRAQANAYSGSTITALHSDLQKILPLLQRVNF